SEAFRKFTTGPSMTGTSVKETMSEPHNYNPATAGSASGQRRHGSDDAQRFGHLPPVLPPLGPSELQIDISSVVLQSEMEVASPSFSIPTPEPIAAEDQQLVQQCLQ